MQRRTNSAENIANLQDDAVNNPRAFVRIRKFILINFKQ